MAEKAKENFIKKATLLYGSNYDYRNIEYIDFYTPINVVCKKHGVFTITPRSHLRGNGCTKCQTKKFDLFVSKAIQKFNGKYKYELFTDYDFKSDNKIKIICPVHGEFFQTTYGHIRGNGCPKCSYEKESEKVCLGYYEFTKRCNKIHNNKYSYELVEYKNNRNKVEIICPVHGSFYQYPHDHLNGCGCPKCKGRKAK